MKKFLSFILAAATLAFVPLAFATSLEETYPPFRADMAAGAAYTIDARALHPTQFALGFREVRHKAKAISQKDAAALVVYLKKKNVPVVIGPGGVPYLTDGHHTMRALLDSTQPDKTAYGHIIANWSDLTPDAFWAKMRATNHTYLNDAEGRGPQDPATLPATLLDMQSNRYRGLSWAVLEAGGFTERKDVYFQEFFWADFFRGKVMWDDTDDADFARAVAAAVKLAHSPAAAHLPGYKPAQ